MPRNRRKRRKTGSPKPTPPSSKTFLEVLGSQAEVDRFIDYLYTMPGYVAFTEEAEIIMERYKQRVVKEYRRQYAVTREQDVLMWQMQQGA